jgi:UDP-glucose 4-epimerase
MKCLILGGGGFLGSHLSDALLAQGHSVRIFDRPNLVRFRLFQQDEAVEWYEGDFINREHLAAAVSGCEVIYHLVSTTLPRSSNENPAYDVETNVIGTLHLLEVARKSGIRKFIFVSSGGTIYGIPREVPIKESHSTEPICSYGIGKLAIEKYINLFRLLHGMECCVLRLANPFGERQRVAAAQGAVTVFLDKALRNEVIEIWGNGSTIRDYFHVSDAVSAMTKALSYEGSSGVFNIGSGVGQSLNEILHEIEALLGRPLKRSYLPARAFDVPASVLDISKAVEILGWRPQLSFAEGLSRTARWLKSGQLER